MDFGSNVDFDKHADTFRSFEKVIRDCQDLLDCLGDVLSSQTLICISGDKTYMLHDEFLQSCVQTLHNVLHCCKQGCISDASILARKYRDDLFLYLYIIEVLSKRKGLTENEINGILGDNPIPTEESWMKIIESQYTILASGSRKNADDLAVDSWFNNSSDNGSYRNKLDIKNYLRVLKQDPIVNQCVSECDLDAILKEISLRLNNYTHNNGRMYLDHNLYGRTRREDIEVYIDSLSKDVSYITSAFLALLILIKPNAIMSYDYVFCLEEGLEPPEDSQYWVASFAQEFIDCYIVKLHPELKPFIKNNNKYGMQIE